MIGLIRQWLTAVVLVTMRLSVAQTLVPEGTVRKITSFIGGLLLLVVMLQPLLRTDLGSLRIHAEDYAAAIEERQVELESAENEALAQGIAERTAAYISDKAAGLGLTVTVRVETEPGADGTPLPERVYLEGTKSEELSHWLAEELGIPAERQVWNGQETGN